MPTKQQAHFLRLAYDYINDPVNEYGLFPNHKWFEESLGISKSGVSNLKGALLREGYLEVREGRVYLTKKARQFINETPDRDEPFTLHVLTPGDVSAGRKASGEIRVYANEINDRLTDFIAIPDREIHSQIVAYRVVGDSMEEEGILEGDYVIVEVDPKKAFSENKLIVAKYLLKDEEIERDIPMGPTLKFYKGEKLDSENRKYVLLGARKEIFGRDYPYKIEAGYIEPVGVVIGIYRFIN